MNVQITIDIVCVWSYLAYRRFQHVLAEVRSGGASIDVHFRPFQLDPRATVSGEPKRELERKLFGPDFDPAAAVADLNALGADRGAAFASDAVWSNTFEAHRLIAVASAQALAEPMVERLFRAHHAEGANIAHRATLQGLADDAGVDWSDDLADQTRAALDAVRHEGTRGVPVFAIDGTRPLVGDQSEEAFHAALARWREFSAS